MCYQRVSAQKCCPMVVLSEWRYTKSSPSPYSPTATPAMGGRFRNYSASCSILTARFLKTCCLWASSSSAQPSLSLPAPQTPHVLGISTLLWDAGGRGQHVHKLRGEKEGRRSSRYTKLVSSGGLIPPSFRNKNDHILQNFLNQCQLRSWDTCQPLKPCCLSRLPAPQMYGCTALGAQAPKLCHRRTAPSLQGALTHEIQEKSRTLCVLLQKFNRPALPAQISARFGLATGNWSLGWHRAPGDGSAFRHLIDSGEQQHGAALFFNPVLVLVSTEQLLKWWQ